MTQRVSRRIGLWRATRRRVSLLRRGRVLQVGKVQPRRARDETADGWARGREQSGDARRCGARAAAARLLVAAQRGTPQRGRTALSGWRVRQRVARASPSSLTPAQACLLLVARSRLLAFTLYSLFVTSCVEWHLTRPRTIRPSFPPRRRHSATNSPAFNVCRGGSRRRRVTRERTLPERGDVGGCLRRFTTRPALRSVPSMRTTTRGASRRCKGGTPRRWCVLRAWRRHALSFRRPNAGKLRLQPLLSSESTTQTALRLEPEDEEDALAPASSAAPTPAPTVLPALAPQLPQPRKRGGTATSKDKHWGPAAQRRRPLEPACCRVEGCASSSTNTPAWLVFNTRTRCAV